MKLMCPSFGEECKIIQIENIRCTFVIDLCNTANQWQRCMHPFTKFREPRLISFAFRTLKPIKE